jgi:hypothetical protein
MEKIKAEDIDNIYADMVDSLGKKRDNISKQVEGILK